MRQITQDLDRSTTQLGLPPPGALELIDGDRVVGWVKNNRVGFLGFGSADEAAHAAWVAYRTMSRRLARRTGARPVPIDVEPLAIHRSGDLEMIAASGREFARLVRFAPEDGEGSPNVGFEITVPSVQAELDVRAKAYAMYRTIRKSGIAWEMWRRIPAAPRERPQAATGERPRDEAPSALGFASKSLLAGFVIVFAIVLLLTMPTTVLVPLALVLGTGFVAGGALILADRWTENRKDDTSRMKTDGIQYAEVSR